MAITKDKKTKILADINNILRNSKTIVFVNFSKMTSEDANELRATFAEKEVGYLVSKKTLFKKAFSQSNIEGEFPELEGEIAIAYSDDVLASAQAVGKASKDFKDKINIVGGVYENEYIDMTKMSTLSNIPPIKDLYAQFLSIIKTPIAQYTQILSAIAKTKE